MGFHSIWWNELRMHEHAIQNDHVVAMSWNLYLLADKRTQWKFLYFTLVVITLLFGVALWIAVGVVNLNSSKSGLHVISLQVTRYLQGNMFVVHNAYISILLGYLHVKVCVMCVASQAIEKLNQRQRGNVWYAAIADFRTMSMKIGVPYKTMCRFTIPMSKFVVCMLHGLMACTTGV